MGNIKRIFNNFQNAKIKYLILIIFIIIMNVCVFTYLKVENYNLSIVEEIRTKYGSYVTIEKDPRFLDSTDEVANLTYDDYEKIGSSQYVEQTYYEQTLYFRMENASLGEGIEWFNGNLNLYDYLTIVGSNNLNNDFDFLFNNIELSSGRLPKNEFEIIVSSNFAKENNIKLNQYESISYNNVVMKFKIVGFYDSKLNSNLNLNTVYTTYDTTQLISQSKDNIEAMYHLKSYRDVKLFEKELYDAGLSELYYVNNNQILIDEETSPYIKNINIINSLKNTTFIIFIILILIAASVIFKSKKDVITIFRMLGVSKSKLLLLTFLELTIVVIVSLIVAIFIIFLINILFLLFFQIPILYYVNIFKDMFILNLVILVLINLETLLFINGYNVNEIVTQKI